MRASEEFFNLYNHDFVRVAVAIPAVKVADPRYNAEQTIALIEQAADSAGDPGALPRAGPLGLFL